MRARRMGNLGEARGEGRHVQQGLRTGRTEPNPTVGVISPWCKWFLAVSLLGVDDAVAMRGETQTGSPTRLGIVTKSKIGEGESC